MLATVNILKPKVIKIVVYTILIYIKTKTKLELFVMTVGLIAQG